MRISSPVIIWSFVLRSIGGRIGRLVSARGFVTVRCRVSGRLALHFTRGEIGIGETHVVESIIGTRFAGCVIEETTFGPHKAVIPEVEGTAHITGMHTLCIDPNDPLGEGFLVR